MSAASSNYHTHSRYCDGRGELEAYVRFALSRKLAHLGFSSHAPLPFETDWTMSAESLPHYRREVLHLKEKYRGRIAIYLGLEVDYLPGVLSPGSPEIQRLGLDYAIGSVHFLGRLDDGRYWTVDGSLDELEQGLSDSYGGDIRRAAAAYFQRLSEMADLYPPDVIGHFDLIKKNNRGGRFFSEEKPWYRRLVRSCLDRIARSGCILEINTGGVLRKICDDFYPSEWILRKSLEREIPVTLSSDAHRPEHVDGLLGEAGKRLKAIGYRTCRQLNEEGWVEVEL